MQVLTTLPGALVEQCSRFLCEVQQDPSCRGLLFWCGAVSDGFSGSGATCRASDQILAVWTLAIVETDRASAFAESPDQAAALKSGQHSVYVAAVRMQGFAHLSLGRRDTVSFDVCPDEIEQFHLLRRRDHDATR
jgi:hypothetical protein